MSKIKVDDGLKTYDIVNQNDELLGQLTFNPLDTNIVERHKEVMRQLQKLKTEFRKTKKATLADDLARIDKIVYEKIDYLLNAEVAGTLFSIMGPFSLLSNGQFFVENVMAAIGQIINEESKKKSKTVEGKIRKYTEKYD